MTLGRFLRYVNYSGERPDDISPVRWIAMRKWLESRLKADDLEAAIAGENSW